MAEASGPPSAPEVRVRILDSGEVIISRDGYGGGKEHAVMELAGGAAGADSSATGSGSSGSTGTTTTSSNDYVVGEYSWKLLALDLASNIVTAAVIYLGARALMAWFDPQQREKSEAERRKAAHRSGLSTNLRERLAAADLNEHEQSIAADLVEPTQIGVSFQDIGGLDKEIEEIRELVILPMRRPELFRGPHAVMQPTTGILFYGDPGVGKTMLCKAIAAEAGATFLNLRPSSIMNKWFGESQKLVAAVFSLAHKMAPCIIFLDEVESFLRDRGAMDSDHAAMGNVKAEFMALWDGLMSSPVDGAGEAGFSVMVVGATNRPDDIDPAILRRMPRAFHVKAPAERQRAEIFRVTLDKRARAGRRKQRLVDPTSGSAAAAALMQQEQQQQQQQLAGESKSGGGGGGGERKVAASADANDGYDFSNSDIDLKELARLTPGFTGSDIKELCQAAAMIPVRELLDREKKGRRGGGGGFASAASPSPVSVPVRGSGSRVRPLRMSDFTEALNSVPSSEGARDRFQDFQSSGAFSRRRGGGGGGGGGGGAPGGGAAAGGMPAVNLQDIVQMLAAMGAFQGQQGGGGPPGDGGGPGVEEVDD